MFTTESRLQQFPFLADNVYLNTAAEGLPPLAVHQALEQYFRDKQSGMDGRIPHAEQWTRLRELTAQSFGLSIDEVGICSCSSEAYNLAAMALNLQAGDEVVINDLDFPAGATPWLQAKSPATVKIWRHRNGQLHVDDLRPLLSSRTRFVTTSLVSFFNGAKVNLPELTAAVRSHSSALLSVDVTQALGRIPLDLRDVDLIISSTHKWILGTHGGGLVGVPTRSAARLTVPAGGWFNLQNPFGAARFDQAISKPGAASFAVGMPNYPAVYANRAALEFIHGVGVNAIAAHADPLVQHCLEELRRLPVDLLSPTEPQALAGILAFRHPRVDEIHQRLHARKIHAMCHAGRLRIAIHGYNTHADIEALLRELRNSL